MGDQPLLPRCPLSCVIANINVTYALTMTPVAMSLEELIPSQHLKSLVYFILIRTALVISTLLVGLAIPFFGLLISLIRSLLAMLVSLILPCACYLSFLKGKISFLQGSLCVLVIVIGVIASGSEHIRPLHKLLNN